MFFPDPKRMVEVKSYIGDGSPTMAQTVRSVPMAPATAYKAVSALVESGAVWETPAPPGSSKWLNVDEWERMTEEQRDRMASALERIADALEGA